MALDQIDVDKLGEEKKQMSFFEHLEALRWNIVRSLVAIVVVGTGVYLAKDFVFNKIVFAPKYKDFPTYRVICSISDKLCFSPPDLELIAVQMGEMFMTHIKVSFFLGFIFAFPYIFFQIWSFIKPGLYKKEQKAARGIVAVCSFLFISGVLFGYYIISPFAISFLGGYQIPGTTNTTTISSFVNYMVMFTIPAGILFELPIVIYFLAKVGLVTADGMRTFRKMAFVVILIIAAIITPPDVVSQLFIAGPIYFLYEISIFIAKKVERENLLRELSQ